MDLSLDSAGIVQRMAVPANQSKLTIPVVSVDRMMDADATPVIQPHIHPEVARWIREEAKDHPNRLGYQIEFLVPAADVGRKEEVESAVRSYFRSEAEWAGKEFGTILRKGLASLLRAFIIIAALVILFEFLQSLGKSRFYRVLGESLVIIGWVTLWGPLDMLLFERYRMRSRRNIARALSTCKVILTTNPAS